MAAASNSDEAIGYNAYSKKTVEVPTVEILYECSRRKICKLFFNPKYADNIKTILEKWVIAAGGNINMIFHINVVFNYKEKNCVGYAYVMFDPISSGDLWLKLTGLKLKKNTIKYMTEPYYNLNWDIPEIIDNDKIKQMKDYIYDKKLDDKDLSFEMDQKLLDFFKKFFTSLSELAAIRNKYFKNRGEVHFSSIDDSINSNNWADISFDDDDNNPAIYEITRVIVHQIKLTNIIRKPAINFSECGGDDSFYATVVQPEKVRYTNNISNILFVNLKISSLNIDYNDLDQYLRAEFKNFIFDQKKEKNKDVYPKIDFFKYQDALSIYLTFSKNRLCLINKKVVETKEISLDASLANRFIHTLTLNRKVGNIPADTNLIFYPTTEDSLNRNIRTRDTKNRRR